MGERRPGHVTANQIRRLLSPTRPRPRLFSREPRQSSSRRKRCPFSSPGHQHLDQVRDKIDLLRSHLPDLPFQAPLDYIPVLTEHLDSLHTHLSSSEINSTIPSVTPLLVLNEMLDKIATSELYHNLKSSEKAVEDMFEKATHDAKVAVQRSLNGSKLIQYVDLPKEWRNNPFVHRGYRFIPIDKWPLIILSLFALHNETRKQLSSFRCYRGSKECTVQ
jgi:hypothetical protein